MLMVNREASYTYSILLPLDVKFMVGIFIPILSYGGAGHKRGCVCHVPHDYRRRNSKITLRLTIAGIKT